MAEDKTYGDVKDLIIFYVRKLILVVGDFHIPYRKQSLPQKIEQMMIQNKLQHVFCTGNIGNKETYEWLKNLSPDFHCVKGEFDDNLDVFIDQKPIQIGLWKFFLIHGHQIVPWGDEEVLNVHLKEYDADIAISGHTHDAKVSKVDKKYFLNPGSITGAYGPFKNDIIPEFIILEVMGNELGVYVYHLLNGEIIIEKTVFQK